MVTDQQLNGSLRADEKAWRYETYEIKDELCFCKTCKRLVKARSFGGQCYACHVDLFGQLGRKPCPPFPVGQ